MRWRTNPFFYGAVSFPQPDPAILRFHESLAKYQATPVYSLDGLAHQLGVGGIRVKDESQRFGLKAFKALGASPSTKYVLPLEITQLADSFRGFLTASNESDGTPPPSPPSVASGPPSG